MALFERRPRTPGADRAGAHPAAARRPSSWSACRRSPTGCAADGGAPQLTVTTTGGFASLWLIPRLRTLHRAAPRRRCAHLGQLQDRQPGAQPGGRGGALLPGRRRRRRRRSGCSARSCFPICSPALQSDGAHPLRDARRPASTTRCCTWTRRRGHAGLGHVARRAGPSRSQARGLHPVRHLRADDPGRAQRPGRRHGHRPAGGGLIEVGPAGGAVLQES